MSDNSLFWPESYNLLVDLENALYLCDESGSTLYADLKSGNYTPIAEKLLMACQRDLKYCLAGNKAYSNYWTNIFIVIQLNIMAAWFFKQNEMSRGARRAAPIFNGVSNVIKGILSDNEDAPDFERGLLHELKADTELIAGNASSAADSYIIASMCYNQYRKEEQSQFSLYPEMEPFFLQYDLIWRENLINGFADAYEFVKDFSKRAEAKLAYAILSATKIVRQDL